MSPPLDSGADSTALHAIDFPLWGSRLIEASAGTGNPIPNRRQSA